MALSEAVLAAIRDELAEPEDTSEEWHDEWVVLDVARKLLADRDELAAEVERLRPLAAIGEAVKRMPSLAGRWGEFVRLVYSACSRPGGTWFVTTVLGNGSSEIIGGKEQITPEEALRIACLTDKRP